MKRVFDGKTVSGANGAPWEKWRVCFITYRPYPLVAIVPACISTRVSEAGYSVTVLSFTEGQNDEEEVYKGITINRFALPGPRFAKRSMGHFVKKCISYIRDRDFDIVHIFSCPYFGLIGQCGGRKRAYLYHMLSYPLGSTRRRILQSKVSIFFHCLFMDKVVIQSRELMQQLPGIRGLFKACLIPTGFDPDTIAPKNTRARMRIRGKLSIPEDHIVPVFVGSIQKKRKLGKLIHAFDEVLRVRKKVTPVIIGDGDALDAMIALAEFLGVRDRIRFTGRVHHDHLAEYLSAADIAVSYVPMNELFHYSPAVKTYEFLAMGLPLIATATVSNRRVVKNRHNGLLVPDGPRDLARGLLELVDNKDLRQKIARNARASVEGFSFERIVREEILPLYETLLKQKRKLRAL